MKERWRAHRAGILNFWYYDEQEFHLEGGRLLFRGANGAGKSVTMQSFLPLVLDGDTRPSRLDPFGSKDRKMDYYLLGEEGQHTDRTGYLWMEFYHSGLDQYRTIGIGLRARRGKTELGFWGFAITDNRRIGYDLNLYQQDYTQGTEEKLPLDWKALRDLIGPEGGHVVQSRKEYRALVNKLLFHYKDVKHFQEMLDLMIHLRSPKLSKDFKPTTIYEILNNGLPPLQEDELRPLAEVLEAIDQIGDRKTELSTHVEFVKKLSDAYTRYNRHQLYQMAERVVQADDLRLKQAAEIEQRETEKQEKEAETAEIRLQTQTIEQENRQAMAEIKILEQNEAFEKERELKNKQDQKKQLLEELKKTKDRRDYWQKTQEKINERLQQTMAESLRQETKQQELLTDLESLAREAEFRYHDVFHARFSPEIPRDSKMWDSWKRGIDEHEKALRIALDGAREHAQAKKRVQDREADLGVATLHRDQMEQEMQRAESFLEMTKEQQQSRFFAWRKGVHLLTLEDAEMTRLLHVLARFPETTYELMRAVVKERYDALLSVIWQDKAKAESTDKQLQEEEQKKAAEIKEWKNQREPEPMRSVNRERTRKSYRDRQIVGVPLYAACEFQPHVSEAQRGCLEALLQETGLLDAWVGGQGLTWTREDEEVLVQPNPLVFGYSLADYLKPTPPEDNSVTAEQIDLILRSIEVGTVPGPSERVILSEDGWFQMGNFTGKVCPKPRAEYIGKESRRQTRLAEIARLEQEMDQIHAARKEQAIILQELVEKEEDLKADLASFPTEEELLAARDQLQGTKVRFKASEEELERKNTQFKEAVQKESEARQKLRELTEKWSFLKQESYLFQAVEQFRMYRNDFFELRSLWNQYVNLQQNIERDREEVANAAEQTEIEQEQWDQYQEMLREVEAVIKAYENTLREMGVEEIYANLNRLRDQVDEGTKQLKVLDEKFKQLEIEKGILSDRLETDRVQFRETLSSLHRCLQDWCWEWGLKLLEEWRDQMISENMAERVETCRHVVQAYRGRFEKNRPETVVNTLFGVFNEVRPHLHEYVLEMHLDSSGRQAVQFKYDRMNPITPERLLQDLEVKLVEQNLLLSEKEQELLEKVLIQSVGVSIRERIQRAEEWVGQMNALMKQRQTSSGLQLRLKWEPKPKGTETELDTGDLVNLLRIDYEHLTESEREQIYTHFQAKIQSAKIAAEDQRALRHVIQEFLDYRDWYRFKLSYKKGEQTDYRELTDSKFNVLSGGEKAMAMYIPLFAAVSSRYNGSAPESPKLISLDEAFAGVDEENVRDMFDLLTQMEFDYMMTSQVLWGCFDTVPSLSIYEIVRPKDAEYVDVIPYIWNGHKRIVNFTGLEQDQAV